MLAMQQNRTPQFGLSQASCASYSTVSTTNGPAKRMASREEKGKGVVMEIHKKPATWWLVRGLPRIGDGHADGRGQTDKDGSQETYKASESKYEAPELANGRYGEKRVGDTRSRHQNWRDSEREKGPKKKNDVISRDRDKSCGIEQTSRKSNPICLMKSEPAKRERDVMAAKGGVLM